MSEPGKVSTLVEAGSALGAEIRFQGDQGGRVDMQELAAHWDVARHALPDDVVARADAFLRWGIPERIITLEAELAEAQRMQVVWASRCDEYVSRAKAAEAQRDALAVALEFYADPTTYLAIGFFPDPPCGDFMDDFDDTGEEWGVRPGKIARAALTAAQDTEETT